MKIIKLKKEFLEKALLFNKKLNYEGVGLLLSIDEKDIFIPLTSQIKYDVTKLEKPDYPFYNIGNKRTYGTLMIIDYLYVHHSVFSLVEADDRIKDEIIFFKENKEIIVKKLKRRIR